MSWNEGVIAENKQVVKILVLDFTRQDKITYFLDNLESLTTFNPLILNCLGLLLEDQLSCCRISIIYENFNMPLLDWVHRAHQQTKTAGGSRKGSSVDIEYPDLLRRQGKVDHRLVLAYQLIYAAFSLKAYYKLVSFLNFDWLFITQEGNLKILLPCFSQLFKIYKVQDFCLALKTIKSKEALLCYDNSWLDNDFVLKNQHYLQSVLEFSVFVVTYTIFFGQQPFQYPSSNSKSPQDRSLNRSNMPFVDRLESLFKESAIFKTEAPIMVQHFKENYCKLLPKVDEPKQDGQVNILLDLIMDLESLLPVSNHINDIKYFFSFLEDQEIYKDNEVMQCKSYLSTNLTIIKDNSKKNGKSYVVFFDGSELMDVLIPFGQGGQIKLKYFFSETAWLEMTLTPFFTPVNAKFLSGQSRHHIKEVLYTDFPDDYRILNFRSMISKWVDFLAGVEKNAQKDTQYQGGGPQGADLFNEYSYEGLFELSAGFEERRS